MRAALLHGRSALEAWEEWRARTDIDHLDAGSYRLLPLLYRNLHRQGARDPTLEGFRNHYHRVWRENQLLFHRSTPTGNSLNKISWQVNRQTSPGLVNS